MAPSMYSRAKIFLVSFVIFVDFTTCNDNSRLNLTGIEDPGVVELVMDYFRLCPYSATCSAVPFHPDMFNIMFMVGELRQGCCELCSCGSEDVCKTERNCCPDALSSVPNEVELAENPVLTACVYPQLRPYHPDKFNAISSSMVIDCPTLFANDTIRGLCRTKFVEIDILDNPARMAPVRDQISGNIYRNRFCAECHGKNATNLVTWSIGVVCEHGKALFLDSLDDALKDLQIKDGCNIAFVSPEALQSFDMSFEKICYDGLDVCNETGLWQDYDEKTDAYCRSYHSKYKDFKNIHCYLCNGFFESQISTFCPSSSFFSMGYNFQVELNTDSESLLQPYTDILGKSQESGNQELLQGSTHGKHCPEGTKYDKYKKRCRPLLCSPKMMLKAGWCEPVHTIAYDVAYTVDFKIVPDSNSLLPITEVRQDVISTLTDMFSFMPDDRYTAEMLVKLNVSFSALSKVDLVDQNIEYIAVRVVVKPWDVFNGGTAIKDITALWPIFQLIGQKQYFPFQNYTVEYVVFNTSLFDNSSSRYSNARFEESVNDDFGTVVNERLSFESISDGQTWLVLKTMRQLIYGPGGVRYYMPVSQLQLCPKVRVESKDYIRVESGVSVSGLSRVLKLSEVVFDYTSSEEGLLTCASTYFTNLVEQKTVKFDELTSSEFLTQAVLVSLSLFPLLATHLAQCCFSPCRTVQGLIAVCFVLMLLSSQLLQLVVLLMDTVMNPVACNALGTLLHLTRLSVVTLPVVGALHVLWVDRKGNQYSATKGGNAVACLWLPLAVVVPVVVVAIYVAVSVTTSDTVDTWSHPFLGYHGNQCLMFPKHMITYSFVVPMYVVIFFILFIYMYFVLTYKRTKNESSTSLLRVHVSLTVLNGLSWMFYFLRLFFGIHAGSYVFAFLQFLLAFSVMTNFAVRPRMRKLLYKPAEIARSSIRKSEASDLGISTVTENFHEHTEKTVNTRQSPSKGLIESNGNDDDANQISSNEQDCKF